MLVSWFCCMANNVRPPGLPMDSGMLVSWFCARYNPVRAARLPMDPRRLISWFSCGGGKCEACEVADGPRDARQLVVHQIQVSQLRERRRIQHRA